MTFEIPAMIINKNWRKLLALLGSFILILLAPALCRTSDDNLSNQDIAVLSEAYNLWSSAGDSIWRGATKISIPVVYVKHDREYAIGFPSHLEGFAAFPPSALLNKSVQFRKRTFSPTLSASFPVAGSPAVVIGSPEALGKTPEDWVITATHEMFHVLQAAHGSYAKIASLEIAPANNPAWQLNFPFPYKDADVMRLIHLQGFPLWLAATSTQPADAVYDIGTALDAAHVYKAYLDLIKADKSYRYSEFQEWTEGVAAYTEYRFAEAAASPTYQPTSAFSALPAFQGYGRLWSQVYKARPFLIKHAGRAAQDRNAFYHLGFGKALALDAISPNWKQQYFAPQVWLDDLLATVIAENK